MDGIETGVIDAGVADPIESGAADPVIDQGAQDDGQATDVPRGTLEADGQEAEQEEISGDGRTLPKDVQSALKALRELNPQNAKVVDSLRKSFFGHEQFTKIYPTPAAAQSAKAALDLVGGSEGIAGLQSQISAVEQMDAGLEQGDPAVLDDVIKDFPEGFRKLAPHVLDKLQSLDPASYAKTLQPHVYGALENAGFGEVLHGIVQALEANNIAGAKDLLGKTQRWLDGQKQQAGQRSTQPDPERQKFETERQKFNQEKEQSFRQGIGRETTSYQNGKIDKGLTPYLKGKNLSADAKSDLVDGVNREINRLLKANTSYQTQMKAFLSSKTRDEGKIVSYIKAAIDEAEAKATKAVWTRRYGSVTPAKPVPKPGAGTPQAAAGVVKLPAQPKREEVDWDKDPSRMLFITGKAFMKSGPYKGRQVTW